MHKHVLSPKKIPKVDHEEDRLRFPILFEQLPELAGQTEEVYQTFCSRIECPSLILATTSKELHLAISRLSFHALHALAEALFYVVHTAGNDLPRSYSKAGFEVLVGGNTYLRMIVERMPSVRVSSFRSWEGNHIEWEMKVLSLTPVND